ncbi:heparinase II/III-family protein [Candidatus Pelagibacter communis]|uniref:heparinase II/III-family protein n=1 Tax=Pelagibacter ubique TaxID=198252 RepID=UPI000A87C448|nr:heparinase II/III-family protein [Candidatus Pelagibacter ubique]
MIKKIEDDQDKWHISAKHDGYQKKYGLNIQRDLIFFKNKNKFIGTDKIISKRGFQNLEYEIRFHLMPGINAIKTQDQKSILIQLKKSGWKFTCDKEIFDIEKGLYFGRKNSFSENLNIFINGFISNEEEEINWSIEKI